MDRPPRPRARPMSAKPSVGSCSSTSLTTNLMRRATANNHDDEDDEDLKIQDDDADDDFGDEVIMKQAAMMAATAAATKQRAMLERFSSTDSLQKIMMDEKTTPRENPTKAPASKPHWRPSSAKREAPQRFRPTSAPPRRANPWHNEGKQHQPPANASNAVSIEYLRRAAEKKKARDREFARTLQREENEYKKKITLKIDQANKMSIGTGSRRTFMLAPDREGVHMIKVVDPSSSDRVISVEAFLREFEKLATVQIGTSGGTGLNKTSSRQRLESQAVQEATASSPPSPPPQQQPPLPFKAKKSKVPTHLPLHPKTTTAPPPQTGPNDRTLVQEELKSVLASTIELTKVLQEQLHELKLKGWNFAARQHPGPGTRTS